MVRIEVCDCANVRLVLANKKTVGEWALILEDSMNMQGTFLRMPESLTFWKRFCEYHFF